MLSDSVTTNHTKVYYGLLKEPDLNIPLEEEEAQTEGDGDKPYKSLLIVSQLTIQVIWLCYS